MILATFHVCMFGFRRKYSLFKNVKSSKSNSVKKLQKMETFLKPLQSLSKLHIIIYNENFENNLDGDNSIENFTERKGKVKWNPNQDYQKSTPMKGPKIRIVAC